MRVPFAKVRRYFPDEDSIGLDELFRWVGYPEHITNPNFLNTCAIRMSLALLGAGFPNPGTYPVLAGRYKGRMIETQAKKLSNFLARQLGQPEKYKSGPEAEKAVDGRHGIVSFFRLHGPTDPQSHISIVAKAAGTWGILRCGREVEGPDKSTGCYWQAVEVWFWPLP